MPDNTTLNPGAAGDVAVTREISHGGDTAKLQGVFVMGISGTEGSYTAAAVNGDATNGMDVDVTRVGGGGVAHDAAATSQNPLTVGGYASAAAPADVSADGDAVRAWMLRNGAQATVVTAAGALVGGDATNGLDVDVTRVIPGTSATHLGKAVDSAAGATDTGVAVLFQRDDSLSALTPAEGDYVHGRVDANGAIHVRVSAGGISGIVDDAAFTVGTSETVPVGFLADETAPDSVDEGDMGAARMTLDRKQIVTPRPHASGGLSIFRSIDLDETEEDIKTSAGQLYGYYFYNAAASIRYLKFYNATAANVTVGTTTPVLTIPVPATTAGHVPFDHGIAFSTAISAAVTTGLADNDTGAPGANDFILNAFYA